MITNLIIIKMKNYTLYYDNKHHHYYDYNIKPYNYYPSYYQLTCILGFLIYNLLGYYNIDITIIIQDRLLLKIIHISSIIISVICLFELIKIMTY
jgi:hypothetical protein